MADHENRGWAVYDHASDQPRPTGRRRQVADWGVGEELFDRLPNRRFGRDGEPHRRGDHGAPRQIPRGGADDGRRTIVIESGDGELPPDPGRREPVEEEFASREDALRAREEHDAVWGGDEPFGEERFGGDEPFERDDRDRPGDDRDRPFGGAHDGAGSVSDGIVRGGQAGRRTVRIGGRPGEFHPPARRRPARTVSERLGPRPDRVAAWAFALGLLLILIAVATANAAVPI
jgi:hypothetical protein